MHSSARQPPQAVPPLLRPPWRRGSPLSYWHAEGGDLYILYSVEEGATIGTTALVYWQLHSSLYTGEVQGYWSTPNWSNRRQGCRQVTTIASYTVHSTLDQQPSSNHPGLQHCLALQLGTPSHRLEGVTFIVVVPPPPATGLWRRSLQRWIYLLLFQLFIGYFLHYIKT
jgi:hypothetical protein